MSVLQSVLLFSKDFLFHCITLGGRGEAIRLIYLFNGGGGDRAQDLGTLSTRSTTALCYSRHRKLVPLGWKFVFPLATCPAGPAHTGNHTRGARHPAPARLPRNRSGGCASEGAGDTTGQASQAGAGDLPLAALDLVTWEGRRGCLTKCLLLLNHKVVPLKLIEYCKSTIPIPPNQTPNCLL